MPTEQERYNLAREMFSFASGEQSLKDALVAFQELGDFPGAKEYAEKCQKLLAWSVGATVEFGTWKGKPITWTVLESFGRERLLFANQVIGPVPYSETKRVTYWDNSYLRQWLNGEFARTCFTLAEQIVVIPTPLKNEPNPVIFSQNGQDTTDKFYIFSHQEIEKRGFTKEQLAMGPYYWVRNPGITLYASECIFEDGTLYHPGVNCEDKTMMVRPVVKIRL